MTTPTRDAVVEATRLNDRAGRLVERGEYLQAAVCYRMAASYAITAEGRAVLIDKANAAETKVTERAS